MGAPRVIDDTASTTLGRRLAPLVTLIAIGGTRSRAEVAAWLYPEADAETGRRNLRQLLHKQGDVLASVIEQDGEMLSLRSDIDVDALREAIGVRPGATPEPADGSSTLAPPTPLLGSLRFAGLTKFQHWLDDERQRRLSAWCDGLSAQGRADEQAGRLDAALRRVLALVAASPTAEAAHRWLMRLQHARGDRSAALAAFDRCEQLLKDELGTRPDAETLRLLDTIESAQSVPPPLPSTVPASVLRPPELVGRAAAWRALAASWTARDTLLVCGDAGIGKSRLIADFVTAHAAGAGSAKSSVVNVSARPGDERLPNVLLTRLLRALLARGIETPAGVRRELARLLPELGEAPQAAAGRTRFVNAIDAFVTAAAATGLDAIVVDDLHFADDASIEAIGHLAGAAGLRWLFACRPAQLSASARQFVDTLATLGSTRTVALEPLARADVGLLVASLGVEGLGAREWADTLHARSGGNPLFLLETIKALLARDPELPAPTPHTLLPHPAPTVLALIEQRMTLLSADAVRLARCAAVAGTSFSSSLASSVLRVRPLDLADAWRELEAAHVLTDGAFVHDLVQEAALASLPAAIVCQLHAEIAHCLVASGASPAQIAAHAEAGALHEMAATRWRAAGDAALLSGRRLDAATCHARAAAAYTLLGHPHEVFASRRDEAQARADHLGDAEARSLIERLIALAGDTRERVAALQLQANFLSRRGEHAAAATAGAEALAELTALDDPDLHLRLAVTTAHAHVMLGAPESALATLQTCDLWVRVHGDQAQRLRYAGALAQVFDALGRLADSRAQYGVALDLARLHAQGEVPMLLCNLAAVHHKEGTVAQAAVLAEEAVKLASESTDDALTTDLSTMSFHLAKYLCDLGRYAESIALAGRLADEFSAVQATYWKRSADVLLAVSFLHLGQFARVAALIDDVREPLPPPLRAVAWGLRSELARAAGAAGQVHRDMVTHADDPLRAGPRGPWHAASLWRSRDLPPSEAVVRLDEAIAWYTTAGRLGYLVAAHSRASEAARRAGAPDKAVAHARAAIGFAADHDAPLFYRGEVWLQAACAFAEIGDVAAVRQAVGQGIDRIRASLAHVAPEFRASFLERNPTNAALLALAATHGVARSLV